jgi:hypothetical protein
VAGPGSSSADQAMASITTYLQVWWSWLAANGFAILLIVYLSSTVCLIALALHAHSMALAISRISKSTGRLSAKLDNLIKSEAEHRAALDSAGLPPESPSQAFDPLGGSSATSVDAERLRSELELLIADITADKEFDRQPVKPAEPHSQV